MRQTTLISQVSFFLCLFGLCGWLHSTAAAQIGELAPPRIAILSDAESRDLEAEITAELSQRKDLTLVERQDLAKIADERKLEQMGMRDPAALGRLIGADGLLFMSKTHQAVRFRLTAVALGYALFDKQLDSPNDRTAVIQSVTRLTAEYASKLKIDPTETVPIALLNLRSDLASLSSASLERDLTLLLESYMASVPEFILLERRHAGPLGFEHSLKAAQRPLLLGGCIIDGVISARPQNADELLVRLRLRWPDKKESEIEVRGDLNNLPSLAAQMTLEIREATGKTKNPVEWLSTNEAREYLMEGLWGWRHGANDAALEALDSAELLGEKAADLVPLRIDILFKRAKREFERIQKNNSQQVSDQLVDDLLLAIFEAARYEAEKLESKLQLLEWRRVFEVRTDQIKESLSNFTSELLVLLDKRGSSRSNELRCALRAITNYDPLNGKLGRADFSNPLNVFTDSHDQWDLSLNEKLAALRLICTMPHQYIPPDLLTGQGAGFCSRFLKTRDDQMRAFNRFLHDLENDPNGRLVHQLILSCASDESVADAAYTEYWKQMWERRKELVTQKVQVQEWTSARPVPQKRRQKHAKEMIPLLRYYLTHVNNYRYWEYALETMWQPPEWSKEEAREIWKDFLDYKIRATADREARDAGPLNLTRFENSFQKHFPSIVANPEATSATEPLTVQFRWHPWSVSGIPDKPVFFDQFQMVGNTLWIAARFLTTPGVQVRIFKLDTHDFHAEAITPEPVLKGYGSIGMRVTPQALYLNEKIRDKSNPHPCLNRFDFTTQLWESREMGLSFEKVFSVNDTLYFTLPEGGIGRYDWDSDAFTLLASSRRRPPQNQFDDCESYEIKDLFAGPDGQPCINLRSGTYYLKDKPGNWPEVFDSAWGLRSKTFANQTLLYSWRGEVVLIDPKLATPMYLMAPSKPVVRKVASLGHESLKEMAPWASKTHWDAPASAEGHRIGLAAGMAGDCLFQVLSNNRDPKSYMLYWYDLKGGRQPRRIPLHFDLDSKNMPPLLSDDKTRTSPPDSNNPLKRFDLSDEGIFPVEGGMVFISSRMGIWFLSHADVEAYLDTHTNPTAVLPMQARKVELPSKEEDVQSQVIGDMIDPSVAEDSFR